MIEIGPTVAIPGIKDCRACSDRIGDHSKECRERFDKAYRDAPELAKGKTAIKDAAKVPSDEAALDAMITDLCDYASTRIGKKFHPNSENTNFDAMVTRLLDRQETLGNPNAIAAIQKEAAGLVSKGTWDLESVKEKEEVIKVARKKGEETHIGSLMTICSEKFA